MQAALARNLRSKSLFAACPRVVPLAAVRNVRIKAQTDKECNIDLETAGEQMCDPVGNVVDISNVGEYCSIDANAKPVMNRTVGEMEQEFLDACGSWYYDGKGKLSDEEFENLKSELLWNGSKVPVLDSNEQRFLEACMSYASGKPILSNEEFDALKAELKLKNSVVTAQGPRCSIRTKKMYSDCTPDYLRMTALNIPFALGVLAVVFAFDDWSGFELTTAIELPPPYGVLLLWGFLLPACYIISASLTNLIFKDALILKGECPNCNSQNVTYFGEILTVQGNRGVNLVDCGSCGASLQFDENKRIIVMDQSPEDKKAKAAEAAAKKAAAAKARAAPPA